MCRIVLCNFRYLPDNTDRCPRVLADILPEDPENSQDSEAEEAEEAEEAAEPEEQI